jgi:hypothetical protein
MRPALLAAAALALVAAQPPPAAAAPAATVSAANDPKSVSDIRCVIVAGTLAQSDDPQAKSLGTASLLYFWGRLEGRGDTANAAARITEQARGMTADSIKTQAKICGDQVTAAGQALQDIGDTLQKQSGANPAPAPPK